MVMPKLPPGERRSIPVYVLLRPREVDALDALCHKGKRKSRASILRDAFLRRYRKLFPKELADE